MKFSSSSNIGKAARTGRKRGVRRNPRSNRWRLPRVCTHMPSAHWRAIVRFGDRVLTIEDCCWDCIPQVVARWDESGTVTVIDTRRKQ